MAHLRPVPVAPVSTGMFRLIGDDRYAALSASVIRAREHLRGRTVWNVGPEASIGAVPEMLRSLVAYALGAGVDARWLAVQGQPELARIARRIYDRLHGLDGDGGRLGEAEHDEYQHLLAPAVLELISMVRPGDVVILHGPEPAGLMPDVRTSGAKVAWRGHGGRAPSNPQARDAWAFLVRYLDAADAYVFSRASTVPPNLPRERVEIIPPSVDPLTPKNNEMRRAEAAAVLIGAGIIEGYSAALPAYVLPSGSMRLILGRAEMLQLEPLEPTSRLVVQISRWDRLKDPVGVMRGFVEHVPPDTRSHLVLAGPELTESPDDPEAAAVLRGATAAWEALPEPARRRVHIAILPASDPGENAAIVNALQRWAQVVVQKSLAEAVGLTVGEAMWKARPVVASRVGELEDEVEHERTGLLLDDPTDLRAFGSAIARLLDHPDEAHMMGEAGVRRIWESNLADRHLRQYADLLSRLVE